MDLSPDLASGHLGDLGIWAIWAFGDFGYFGDLVLAICHVPRHVATEASNSLRRFLRATLTTEHVSESRLASVFYLYLIGPVLLESPSFFFSLVFSYNTAPLAKCLLT